MGSKSGDRKQSHAKPDLGGVSESCTLRHREASTTAPVLDSTQNALQRERERLFSSAIIAGGVTEGEPVVAVLIPRNERLCIWSFLDLEGYLLRPSEPPGCKVWR